MYLHTPAVEAGSWWRVDTASGSDTGTTVYAHDGTDAIPNYYVLTGSTVRNTTRDGTAQFWSGTQTLYLKELTYQGAPNGTVVTSTGVTPAAPVGGAPVDIATISTAVAALPTTYVKLLVTDATSATLTGTLAAGHLSPVDCTVGPGIRTLPAANSVAIGTPTVAKKADTTTNTLTVQRAGSDLIFGTGAGSTSKTLTLSGEAVTFVSNGVDRWSVESSDTPSSAIAAGYAPIAATPVASSATSGTLTAGAEHNLTPSSAATWTLPTGVTATKLPTTVKNNGTAAVTVARGGSDTINGGTASVSIAAGEWARFTSDGAGAWTQSGTAGESGTYAKRGSLSDAAAGLMTTLDFGLQSAAYGVLTDSTGVGSTRWPYLLGQSLAAKYPAYTVLHRAWNNTNKDYDAPTTIQTGTAGANRAVRMPGSAGADCAALPIATVNNLTGDLDIRIKVAFDTAWTTPPGEAVLVARFGTAGNRTLRFSYDNSTNNLLFDISVDGTTLSTVRPNAAWTKPADGAAVWLRVTRTSSTGATNFYQSPDGQTWTAIGTALTATTGALYNSTAEWQIGARSGYAGGGAGWTGGGYVYEVQIRNGINGQIVAPVLPELWPLQMVNNARVLLTTSGAPVLNIVNGAQSGALITDLNSATDEPKRLNNYGQQLVFFACGHNDVGGTSPTQWQNGGPYLALWDTLLSQAKTQLPYASFAVVSENPRVSPATGIPDHAIRQSQIVGWAQRNSIGYTDVYSVFNADSRGVAALLNNDGIHPSDAIGSPLWRDTVLAAILKRAGAS